MKKVRIHAAVIARVALPDNSDFIIMRSTDPAEVLCVDRVILPLKLAVLQDFLESTVAALVPTPVRIECFFNLNYGCCILYTDDRNF